MGEAASSAVPHHAKRIGIAAVEVAHVGVAKVTRLVAEGGWLRWLVWIDVVLVASDGLLTIDTQLVVYILWHAERTQLHELRLLVNTAIAVFVFKHRRVCIALLRLLVKNDAVGSLG